MDASSNVVQFANGEGETASPRQSIPHIESPRDEQLLDLAPKRASAKLLRRLAENPYAGQFTYRLQRTSMSAGFDVTARVKLPSFVNRAMINELPRDVQKIAAELMFSNASTPGRVDPVSNMDRSTKRGREVANLYCVVGFVEPKVYFTQEEAEENNGVWVEDIQFEDRWTFVRISDGADELGRQLISPFLGE